MTSNIIWFKKNLRFHDNQLLLNLNKPSLLIYIIEPDLWIQKDMSIRQWDFIEESLESLNIEFKNHNLHLNIFFGEAINVFKEITNRFSNCKIISEQETGINWTYQRDRKLQLFFKSKGIKWEQYPQIGVKRGNHDRDNWAKNFQNEIKKPLYSDVNYIKNSIILDLPNYKAPANFFDKTPCPNRQKGGSNNAKKLLTTFLSHRGQNYQKEMSSPISAEASCSRLSTHFTYGTISLREAFQLASKRRDELVSRDKVFAKSINAFLSRLHWRSHFIQKLEDQPSIESKSFIPDYDNLRESNEMKLYSWISGKSGVPFIDACMVYLRNHGWINFRMRAMLASFASYNLWLDWRYYGPYLAALFTDFEPGVHYSQLQMQSGTTGINTVRMYNPYKQSEDQDPEALFIKRNISLYKDVPKHIIHHPEKVTPIEKQFLPKNWIDPIINVKESSKSAKEKIFRIRNKASHKLVAKSVFIKHGSRKSI